jgi:hypothetical protein
MAKGIVKIKGTAGTGGSIALTSIEGGTTKIPLGSVLEISEQLAYELNVGDIVSFDIISGLEGRLNTAANVTLISSATIK